MSDTKLRSLQRKAQGGSVEDRAAHLRERLRAGRLHAGQIDPEMLALAGYCGDEAAIAVLGIRGCMGRNERDEAIWGGLDFVGLPGDRGLKFAGWVSGLSRWGPRVLVRAAIAAARVAAEKSGSGTWRAAPHGACFCGYGWDAHHNRDKNPRLNDAMRAIEAAEAWVECPCEEHRVACRRFHDNPGTSMTIEWRLLISAPVIVGDPRGFAEGADSDAPRAITHFAQLAGEAPVRAAIQSSLISYALREATHG